MKRWKWSLDRRFFSNHQKGWYTFFVSPMTSGFWLFCHMVYNYCKTISTPNWKLMALYSFVANGIHLTSNITLTNPLFIYILGTVRSTLSCIYKPHCHANHCYDNFLLNMNFGWIMFCLKDNTISEHHTVTTKHFSSSQPFSGTPRVSSLWE